MSYYPRPRSSSTLEKIGLAVLVLIVSGVIGFAGLQFREVVATASQTHDSVLVNTQIIQSMRKDMDGVPALRQRVDRLDDGYGVLRSDVNDLQRRQGKDDVYRETHGRPR